MKLNIIIRISLASLFLIILPYIRLICCIPFLIVFFLMVLTPAIAETTTIYVAVNGSDTNPGTLSAPVATITKAVNLIDLAKATTGEIVVGDGLYPVTSTIVIIPRLGTGYDPNRTLLIRAADGAHPLFDGGSQVTLTALEGEKDIYLVPGAFSRSYLPQIWEESSRARYNEVADLRTLRYTDYGMWLYSTTQMAIRSKAGIKPAPGELRLSTLNYGLDIARDNVTVKGLYFKGFGKTYDAAAVHVGYTAETSGVTSGVVLDGLHVENSYSGIRIDRGTRYTEVKNCVIKDVAGGIAQWGGNASIHHCDIRKDDSPSNLFKFKNPAPMSGVYGIMSYYNSTGGTYRYNFIKGFQYTIFVKTIEGCDSISAPPAPYCTSGTKTLTPGGPFIIEHNTLTDDPYLRNNVLSQNSWGVNFVRYSNYGKANAIVRYNIMDGFSIPFNYDTSLTTSGALIDRNLFWSPLGSAAASYIQSLKDKGMGDNTIGRPFFVDRDNDDYRLSTGSKALTISTDDELPADQRKPIGAFPTVSSTIPLLDIGVTYTGGKQYDSRTYTNAWDVTTSAVVMNLYPSVAVTNTKVSIVSQSNGQEVYSNTHSYLATDTIPLPSSLGLLTLSLAVEDAQGNWSKPVSVIINKVSATATFKDVGYVRANTYGFVVFNHNSQNNWQRLYYKKSGDTTWIQGFHTLDYQNTYTAPYTDLRNIGAQPMMVAGLEPNTVYDYKIVPTYSGAVFFQDQVKTQGAVRVYYIAPDGVDDFERGTRDKPFKTLQFALDLSLPGDDIRLLPGVYFGPSVMFHSGTADHPITIEADQPGTVALDAQQSWNAVLLVSGVSNVIIKNLAIQWALSSGLYCYNCQSVEIVGNTFKNASIGSHNTNGRGLIIGGGHDVSIHHNLIAGWWVGALISSSPNTQFHHNTVLAIAQSGVTVTDFSKNQGSRIMFNSLNYDGNHPLELTFNDQTKSNVTIDYNNYGATFQSSKVSEIDPDMIIPLPQAYGALYAFELRELIYQYLDSVTLAGKVYRSFFQWKNDTGFDTHSIFKDPLWVDPVSEQFNLKPGSPNLLKDGEYIGAFNTSAAINPPASTSGDVSGDGKVTTYDAALVARYSAGGNLTDQQKAKANINGDTKVDNTDAALIAKKALAIK